MTLTLARTRDIEQSRGDVPHPVFDAKNAPDLLCRNFGGGIEIGRIDGRRFRDRQVLRWNRSVDATGGAEHQRGRPAARLTDSLYERRRPGDVRVHQRWPIVAA